MPVQLSHIPYALLEGVRLWVTTRIPHIWSTNLATQTCFRPHILTTEGDHTEEKQLSQIDRESDGAARNEARKHSDPSSSFSPFHSLPLRMECRVGVCWCSHSLPPKLPKSYPSAPTGGKWQNRVPRNMLSVLKWVNFRIKIWAYFTINDRQVFIWKFSLYIFPLKLIKPVFDFRHFY